MELFTIDVFKFTETNDESFKLPDFRYEEIKRKVAGIVKRHNVTSIPINVFNLAKRLGIILIPFSNITQKEWKKFISFGILEDVDGFYLLAEKNGKTVPFIFYNDSKNKGRIRFTILHEIGHFVLRHSQQSTLAEAEANFFAKYLIAPPIIVHQIHPNDYIDIKLKFELSEDCAWNAFGYYIKWLNHFKKTGNEFEEYEKTLLYFLGKQAM